MRTTLPILLLWFGVHNSANADYTDGDAPGTTDGVYIGNALVHRTAENIVITRGRHGLSVTSEHDAWVGAHLRALGEWEEPVRAFIARFALLLAERPSVLPPHEGKTGCLWSSNSIFVVIVVVVRGRGRPRDVAPRVGRPPWSLLSLCHAAAWWRLSRGPPCRLPATISHGSRRTTPSTTIIPRHRSST